MTEQFDLVVIGGGSGGLAAAQRAAEYGANVAVIENGPLGGTCVNVGCVPKKVMWNAAGLAHALHDAGEYGFSLDARPHDWSALKTKRDAYVRRLNGIYARNLEQKNIEHIDARGRFEATDTVIAGERRLHAKHILIATGGYPIVPPLPGADLGITSDGFFDLEDCPRRVAIVGSGYISVELGGMLSALGAKVDVFARFDSVLRSFDEMLQASVIEAMAADGIGFHFHAVPAGLEAAAGGLSLATDDGERHGIFDAVLWAIGRAPATAELELDAAGIETDAQGFVPTDAWQVTNQPGVYAVGDVTGRAALTPVAIAAGRRLADRVFGGMRDRHLDYRNVPTVLFTHPPVGTCGLTEAEARAIHGDGVRTYRSEFVPLFNGVTANKPQSRMKLITVGEEERIVGCHLFGPGVDEMLQGFAVAIRMGATKRDFDDTVAIHPTSAEELVTMR